MGFREGPARSWRAGPAAGRRPVTFPVRAPRVNAHFRFSANVCAIRGNFTNVQSCGGIFPSMPQESTPLPRFVQVEPVGQCNLACRMCPVVLREDAPARGPAFMSFDAFTRILEQFPALDELHLQGMGEPFLHPRITDMIAHATGRGIKVSTNT